MAPSHRSRRSLFARHQWAFWLLTLLLAGTFGFYWLLSRDLKLERIKEKPAQTAKR